MSYTAEALFAEHGKRFMAKDVDGLANEYDDNSIMQLSVDQGPFQRFQGWSEIGPVFTGLFDAKTGQYGEGAEVTVQGVESTDLVTVLLWSSSGGPKDVAQANDTFVINPATNKWSLQTVFVHHKQTKVASKCPFSQRSTPKSAFLQPINLKVLNPPSYLNKYDYAELFKTLDLSAVKADLVNVMRTSQDWWPADYGHYGPFFIRMAWHSAGTYRTFDGRGGGNTGNQRFAPLNSWPDNGNLDKARRLLWPIKKKYGKKLSWADLMIFAGHVAVEDMGLPGFGFAGGRVDTWSPEADVYWGPETVMMDSQRYHSDNKTRGDGDADTLEKPLAAVQMGLIYVNPEGPGGNPDPLKSAADIRVTFERMALNDEETVALIAGGHTFGKCHGANSADTVGPAPEQASIEEQGFGWTNSWESGKGVHTITSGLEGAWTSAPTTWDNGYFHNLFTYDWKLTKSPAGAHQWIPTDEKAADAVPDAHDAKRRHAPIMLTSDMALKLDPVYGPISRRFYENPQQFADAFARAWYKLNTRDMGPVTRCLGSLVPEAQIWQDPCPAPSGPPISDADISALKKSILDAGLTIPQLVRTAWASASTHRVTDYRGGANGARIRFEPQKDWKVNDPAELAQVLTKLEAVQTAFNAESKAQVSLADLIVLGGCAAIEVAGSVPVPFTPGRTDATLEQTDTKSFDVLEPSVDGFRNYLPCPVGQVHSLIDRAHKLSLTAPEMAVLVAGLRVLNANAAGSQVGVLTTQPEKLTNDFFVNLLDMSTSWTKAGQLYEGRDRTTGNVKWTASQVDLIFGSNSELRAIAEHYAMNDYADRFKSDFVAAWTKVMNLDRY
jgi:catalase-peroxidase